MTNLLCSVEIKVGRRNWDDGARVKVEKIVTGLQLLWGYDWFCSRSWKLNRTENAGEDISDVLTEAFVIFSFDGFDSIFDLVGDFQAVDKYVSAVVPCKFDWIFQLFKHFLDLGDFGFIVWGYGRAIRDSI